MNLQENIRRRLKEDKKTKSTNKEFSKYKDSKFNSLRDYTLQDIVDDWDSLSDHKNENIKTIKHFVNNPDKITDLVYDEKGLEDGYHRLIAAKILKKPRFSYRLVENLQETIRRVLREDRQFSNEFKRRVGGFDAFLWNNYVCENPCEFESFGDFIKGIYAEIDQLIEDGDGMDGPVSNWLTYEEGIEYVNRFMLDDLKKLYNDECEEYEY